MKKSLIKPQYDELGVPFVYYTEKKLPIDNAYGSDKKTVYDITGIIPVKKKNKWGLFAIDKEIVKPEYSEISKDYYMPKAWYKVCINGSVKVYDTANQRFVVDEPYSQISFYSGSDADTWVAAVEKNGKWGYINQTGKEIIPCQYEYFSNFNGRTLAKSSDGTSALIKVWPYSGKAEVLIPAGVFDKIENLSNQEFFTLSKGKLQGAYFPSTKTYIAPKYQNLSSVISGYVLMWNGNANPVRGTVTAYNMKGKAVLTANIQIQPQLKAFLQKLM